MLITDSPIPEFWVSFNVFQYHVTLNFLQHLAQHMQQFYLKSNFNVDLWNDYFSVLIQFIRSKRLAAETFTISKATKLTARYIQILKCTFYSSKI